MIETRQEKRPTLDSGECKKTPNASMFKATSFACASIAVAGLAVFLIQLWRIHALWTPVGFVDTWPLYDRLMHWRQGQLSLDHYFFDPHGAHLHFIIYLLYLIDFAFGSGRQLVPHLATLFSILGLIATLSFFFLKVRMASPSSRLPAYALMFGTLILLSGVSEATAIPFQAVVVVTRFVYILLLSILVWCQFVPNKWLHASALIASCLAASFYASGGVFAIEVSAVHLIFFRNWRPLLCSWLPLASYGWFMGHYVKPNAEFLTVGSLLREHSPGTLSEVAIGTVYYYGSELMAGWPHPVHFKMGGPELLLFLIGLSVCAVTVGWAIYTVISISLLAVRTGPIADVRACTSCIMALLSLFVFASAVSASLLWVARARIFGGALGMPAHFAVLTSNRYAAFASVAFVVFLYILQVPIRSRLALIASLATFSVTALCGLNAALRFDPYVDRVRLERAATALLMGMSPADNEASAVWPGVKSDWYWPGELPKTATYLQTGGFAYAYHMPALGQFLGGRSVKIYEYSSEPVPENGNVCRLAGRLASFERMSLFAPQRFFAVTKLRGEVVGYAVRNATAVNGYLNCAAAHEPALFLSDSE